MRAIRPRPCVTTFALLVVHTCAFASQSGQDPFPDPEPVVVTGSRLPVTPDGLAQGVSVIDAEELRQFPPARLEDILAGLSGVYVDAPGATGGFSSLYVRGGENSHLLVLIDGIRANDPTTTRGSAYDLSSIDVRQIERIEFLRGPASAIYGGEALSGVLNIVTRPVSETGVDVSAYGGVGEDDYSRAGSTLAAGIAPLHGRVAFGAARDAGPAGESLLRLNTFSGDARIAPQDALSGEFLARRSSRRSVAFPDDSGGPRLAVNRQRAARDSVDTLLGANVTWETGASLTVRGSASVYDRDEIADNPFVDAGVRMPVPAFTSDTAFRRESAQITITGRGASGSFVAGIEHQHESGRLKSIGDFLFSGTPQELDFSLERSTESIFAESRFRLTAPVSVQIGLRHDRVGGLDAETTPHLGAVWTLPDGATRLKASYGEGFKPPSFFALGFPIGANPGLRPERSNNAELSLDRTIGAGASLAQVSLFQTDYRDLVDFDAATFTYVNRGKIVVRGIEPSLSLSLGPRLRARAGATLLEIGLRDGMAPLRNRPETKLSADIAYDVSDRQSLFAAIVDCGGFTDRSNPTGDVAMPGYTRVDVGFLLRGSRLRFTASIDNLFDETYEQFVGFPAQDRRLRVELQGEY